MVSGTSNFAFDIGYDTDESNAFDNWKYVIFKKKIAVISKLLGENEDLYQKSIVNINNDGWFYLCFRTNIIRLICSNLNTEVLLLLSIAQAISGINTEISFKKLHLKRKTLIEGTNIYLDQEALPENGGIEFNSSSSNVVIGDSVVSAECSKYGIKCSKCEDVYFITLPTIFNMALFLLKKEVITC